MDTSKIELPNNLIDLIEPLAAHVHECWMQTRAKEGWRYSQTRDDKEKLSPLMVPYDQLSESEKETDRVTVRETLKGMLLLTRFPPNWAKEKG
ncbi:MAG TPA: RyR domain-containing protein [Fimbriimonadaceae bacterium]|jgi:hypothetical protein